MKITEIKIQKNGRYAIYCDDEYRFSLCKDTLLETSFSKDIEISQKDIDLVLEKDVQRIANDRALTILSYRDHSKMELKKKLLKDFSEEVAENSAEHMVQIALINDEEYAEKLAKELLEYRLFGKDRAIFELQKRGIDRETANNAVEDLEDDPRVRIRRFIDKKYQGNINDEKIRKRAVAALMRNGFRWDDIKDVLYDLEQECD